MIYFKRAIFYEYAGENLAVHFTQSEGLVRCFDGLPTIALTLLC